MQERPDDILTILKATTKQPKYKHKGGVWSWDSFTHHLQRQTDAFELGILLQSMIVLDFDDAQEAQRWEAQYAILHACPLAKTRKGFHYYLSRTPLCDDLELYDKARCFTEGSQILDVDLKTRCSTGSGGNIVVSPSAGKSWIRPLYSCAIPDVPDDFAERLASMYHKPNPTAPVRPKRSQKSALRPTADSPDYVVPPTVLESLHAIGFKNVSVLSVSDSGFSFDANRSVTGERSSCPLCNHTHENNNWWCIIKQDGIGLKWLIKNYSEKCNIKVRSKGNEATDLDTYECIQIEDYCDPIVQPLPILAYPVCMESALPGMGKTSALVGAINTIADSLHVPVKELKILQTVCRRVMGTNKLEEAKDFIDYKLYTDEIKKMNDLRDVPALMIEFESIWRLLGGQSPDVLILDEVQSILSLFSSETTKKVRECREVVENLFRDAKYIICLDAYYTHGGVCCLNDLLRNAGRRGFLRRNTFQPFNRIALEIPGKGPAKIKGNVLKLVGDLLSAGKKLVLVGGTKNMCDTVHHHVFQHLKLDVACKYYSADSNKDDLDDFKDPDEAWKDTHLLMYTGILTVAVSYNLKTFDTCVVYADATGGPLVRDIFQMVHRVRNYKDESMYYALNTVRFGPRLPLDPVAVRSDKDMVKDLLVSFWNGESLDAPPKWLLDLVVANKLEENHSRVRLRQVFQHYLRVNGYHPSDWRFTASNVKPKRLPNKLDFKYTDLKLLHPIDYQASLRRMYDRDLTKRELLTLKKFVFERQLVSSSDDREKALVFDLICSDKGACKRFFNLYHEFNTDPNEFLLEELQDNYLELVNRRCLQLKLVRKLCRTLCLKNSLDASPISTATFLAKQSDLNELHNNFDKIGMVRACPSTQADTDAQVSPAIVLKNRVSSLFNQEWNGLKLEGVGKRHKILSDKGKRTSVFSQYKLSTDTSVARFGNVVKRSRMASLPMSEVISVFGSAAV
jgi:hypothetical protein